MSQVASTRDVPVAPDRASPPRNWAGTLTGTGECATYYLHLMAFPCDKCKGPVVAGTIGKREDELTRETEITGIGTICLVCGARPQAVTDPVAARHFRPVEWPWITDQKAEPTMTDDDSLASELPHNADPK